MKQYDKNTLIGFVLIAIILIFFLPQETKKLESNTKVKNKNITAEDTNSNNNQIREKTEGEDAKDKAVEEPEIKTLTKDTVTEQEFVLENDSIKLTFSNLRGEITSAVIKGYYSYDEYTKNKKDKTYKAKDIDIFNKKNSNFEITADSFLLKKIQALLPSEKNLMEMLLLNTSMLLIKKT